METNKIAVMVGAVVVLLAILGFVIYRSSPPSSGTIHQGPPVHVTAAARDRHARVPVRPPGQ